MPVTPTYPGVYIEEIPSGVRTITGVATSITAFMGRALRGPVNDPTIINNFGDFESLFGGQEIDYPMSYAVRDFFNNGGSQGLIVRLFNNPSEAKAKKAGAAVLKAIQAVAKGTGATPQSLLDAANKAANEFPKVPGMTAAEVVAKTAEAARAASAARSMADSIEDEPGKTAGDAVADAAEKSVGEVEVDQNGNVKEPNATAVVTAATDRATTLKTIADNIETAANGVGAGDPESNRDAVIGAAQIVVDGDGVDESDKSIVQKIVNVARINTSVTPKAAVTAAVNDFKTAADLVFSAAGNEALDLVRQAAREEADGITADPGRMVADAVADKAEDTAHTTTDTALQAAQARATALNTIADAIQTAAEGTAAGATADEVIAAAQGVVDPLQDPDKPIVREIVDVADANKGDTRDTAITAVSTAVTAFKTAADQVVKAAEEKAKQISQAAIKAILDAASDAEETAVDYAPIKSYSAKLKINTKETNKNLELEAASPGKWGSDLKVFIDSEEIDDAVAERYGLESGDLFNLTIIEGRVDRPDRRERLNNVSVADSSRRLDRVLEEESQLVKVLLDPITKEPEFPKDDQGSLLVPIPNKEVDEEGNPKPYEPSDEEQGDDSAPLVRDNYTGSEKDKTGLYALEKADLFNLLCIPPDTRGKDAETEKEVYSKAMEYCAQKRAFLIVDAPAAWGKVKELAAAKAKKGLGDLGLRGTDARNAAIYFPRVIQSDPLREGQLDTFVPCGIIAGIMARTDVQRGVWKAPAGIDATLSGIEGLQVKLTDAENGLLNPIGINCLRNFRAYGNVVWGSRTLRGADQLADEYKYVPVRRFVLFLEESLYRGTQWVVFEPNDEPLWSQIRLNIGVFMNDLFRQGAFEGKSPQEAYFVKCDSETTTPSDVNRGIVNIVVGFAPLKPAEFVIIKIQQINRLAPT